MEIFTIGFTQKRARQFFGILRESGIRRLIDVRLNNTSQLAAFAKRDDLVFFLEELCGADYLHEPRLSPTKEILDAYKKRAITWEQYEESFTELLAQRDIAQQIDRRLFAVPSVLLCSEPTAEHCHRRLVAEYLQSHWGDVQPVHL